LSDVSQEIDLFQPPRADFLLGVKPAYMREGSTHPAQQSRGHAAYLDPMKVAVPCWRAEWAIPSRRADQGHDCGAAKIHRIAENAPRWPDMNLAAEYESEAPC